MKPNEITKEKFLAWAREQSGKYNYGSPYECALAQYLQAQHPDARVVCGGFSYSVDDEHSEIPGWLRNPLTAGTFEWLVAELEAGE